MTGYKNWLTAQGEALPKISHPLAYMVPIYEHHIGGKLALTVSARELHAFFDSRTRFNTWIKMRIAELDMANEADYVQTFGYHGRFEYFFTFNTAIGVIQVEKGDKARCMRNYLSACEEPLVVATNGEHDKSEPDRDYHALLLYALKDYSAHPGIKANEPRLLVKPHKNLRKDSHALMCDALKERRDRLGKKTERSCYHIGTLSCLLIVVSCREFGDILTGENKGCWSSHVFHSHSPADGSLIGICRAEYPYRVYTMKIL